MIFKTVIKGITPEFIWSFLSFSKFLINSRNIRGLKSIEFIKNSDRVIVLGNGPSLENDLEDIDKKKKGYDFICVNNFCSSKYYESFKPNIYIFLDPYFFSDNAHVDWIKQREKTFNIINNVTDWPMQIFIPQSANIDILKGIIKNKNVDIIKFKVFPYMVQNFKFNNFFYKTGIIGPYMSNVLVYAVYFGIWAKYRNIEIFGADMSFHNDVSVNQENNNVEIEFRHFNSISHKERLMKNPEKVEPVTMQGLLHESTRTFRSHHLLNEIANNDGVEIKNLSKYSLIDAYKRI